MPRALIVGVTGQDGAFLARLLADKGYGVTGTSRSPTTADCRGLDSVGMRSAVDLVALDPTEAGAVAAMLDRVAPDEIYNFSGQSSVAQSFEQPVATLDSIVGATQNLLEAIRASGAPVRFYNAGSSECFGDTGGRPADETTAFAPKSPYGVAKSCAFWQVATYREAYALFAATGILFNHESKLRLPRFVTMKIVRAAWDIAHGSREPLTLGDLDIERDWGWAPDYVDAMWRMLQQPSPRDYVVATGTTMPLRDFVRFAFDHFGLDYARHVRLDPALRRPNELRVSRADPARARTDLGWTASLGGRALVDRLCADYAAARVA